jgi:hypothetical protein
MDPMVIYGLGGLAVFLLLISAFGGKKSEVAQQSEVAAARKFLMTPRYDAEAEEWFNYPSKRAQCAAPITQGEIKIGEKPVKL